MGLATDLLTFACSHPATTATALLTILFSTVVVHRIYLSPLSHVPGPFLARISSLYLIVLCYLGTEGHVLRNWHLQYDTRVLRVAPNSVSISDPSAMREIYMASGGYAKDARYANFNLGPIVSIFSAIDTAYRDVRAKAVAPLFAMGRLRAASRQGGVIAASIATFEQQLRAFKKAGLKADLLDLCARVSIDVVTGYLLGQCYGGLAEHERIKDMRTRQTTKLSANHFIFAIVAWARFSLLPSWAFRYAYSLYSKLTSSDEVASSFAKLDRFTAEVMRKAEPSPPTDAEASPAAPDWYHGRLLAAGAPAHEAAAQAKAITFAGTDSTAVMLATILFHLTRNRTARAQLLAEIRSSSPTADPQTLPYLRAVVSEGLRLGMANPTRLTRVVGADGLEVGAVFVPPGTVVRCAAYTLHHDSDVFPKPFQFRPERWLKDGRDGGLRRPEMERSMMAFGAGLRACIGKSLALQQLYEATRAVVEGEVLDGARTCQERIEMVEWFNGEIKGHRLEIEWSK